MEELQVEITRRTEVLGTLRFPGNQPRLPEHVARALIEQGYAVAIGPKKKRSRTRQNEHGGIDRQMSGGVRGASQETSLDAGSPGVA